MSVSTFRACTAPDLVSSSILPFTSLLISARKEFGSRTVVFKSIIWRGGKIWFFFAFLIVALKCTCLTTVSRQFRAEVDKIWILK